MKKEKVYKAAAYLRLSKGDDDLSVLDKAESNSITNQRLIIMNYIEKHPDISLVREYQDDGYTGMSFERPGLKQMMDDIEAGIVNCIVVKDLSRFGRERIEAETYLLRVFKEKNVRFISINDSYDSLTATSSETHVMLPIKALTNDNYSRDISMKVRSSKAIKRQRGDFVAGMAPYGYMKKADNCNALEIDDDAAEVVRMIFDKKIEGRSALAIAAELTQEGIPTPSEYRRMQGEKVTGFKRVTPGSWSAKAVLRILRNESYTGTMIQGKTRKISYKVKKYIDVPEEEWSRHENAMEPIISKIDFATVQMLLERDTMKMAGSSGTYLYSGMLFCGDCGCPMYRRGTDKAFYICASYEKGRGCSMHRIDEDELDSIVRNNLTEMMKRFGDYPKIMERLGRAEISFDEVVAHDKRIAALEKEISAVNSLLSKLEISLHDGLLGETQYYEFKNAYIKQIDDLKKAIETQKKIISSVYDIGAEAAERLNSMKDGLKMGKITRRGLVTFIDRIDVCRDDTIRIIYRYQPMYDKLMELKNLSDEKLASAVREA